MKFEFSNIYVKFAILTYSLVLAKNNVCPSHVDYFTVQFNSKCWFDPDVDAPIKEIINRHGFKSESYNVTTEDGYILKIFRIPSKLNENGNKTKTPLLFMHGMAVDARSWFLLGDDSPAFYYSNKGYDIWIANRRGTKFSSHIKYSKNDKEFWNYSFHEMGTMDLPAVVEKVAEVSKQPGKIIYIGHSMGTTASYVYCSIKKTHCAKHLKTIISLAPVAKIYKSYSTLAFLMSFARSFGFVLHGLGIHKVDIDFVKIFQRAPLTAVWQALAPLALGKSEPNIFPRIIPILLAHGHTPICIKVLSHYGQVIQNKGQFRQYNYGESENLKKYNSKVPPKYDIKSIPVDVNLIYANDDIIGYKPDVENMYSSLDPSRKAIIEIPENGSAEYLGHSDFFTAANIENVVYPVIDNVLEKM